MNTPAMPMPAASQNKNPLEPFLLLSDCDRPPRMNHAESTPTMTTATPSNFQASQGMFPLFPVYLPYPRYRITDVTRCAPFWKHGRPLRSTKAIHECSCSTNGKPPSCNAYSESFDADQVRHRNLRNPDCCKAGLP